MQNFNDNSKRDFVWGGLHKPYQYILDEADPIAESTSEKQDAIRSIADWKDKMKMVEDHIKFLQNKRLGSMRDKLKIAEKKFNQGDYGWISRELYMTGSPTE